MFFPLLGSCCVQRLCVIRALKCFLAKTDEVRAKKDRLFLCTTPPYGEASKATLSRWVKETLANAGVDTRVFKAHSVRGASTSKLGSLGVPVSDIMAKAQWKTESTFKKFYSKPLLPDVSHKMLYFANDSNKK